MVMLYTHITVYVHTSRDHFELLRIACLSNLVAMLDEWDKDVQYHIALRGSLNCTEENNVIIIHDKTGGSCID